MSELLAARRPVLARFLMQVLWPAFLISIAATGLIFSIIDPEGIPFFYNDLGGNLEAAYTLGFFCLWALFSAACAFTWYLVNSDIEHRVKESKRVKYPSLSETGGE